MRFTSTWPLAQVQRLAIFVASFVSLLSAVSAQQALCPPLSNHCQCPSCGRASCDCAELSLGEIPGPCPPLCPMPAVRFPDEDRSTALPPELLAPPATDTLQPPVISAPDAAQQFDATSVFATNFGAGGATSLAFSAPNMMGDFLSGGRNSLFNYNLAGDLNPSFTSGGSSVTNSKLSDNNSAIPRDRFAVRYHYFNEASTQLALRPMGDLFLSIVSPGSIDAPFEQPVVEGLRRRFDTHLIEFAAERRITEDYSLEIRLPTVVTLDSNLSPVATNPIEPFPNDEPGTLYGQATPFATLGDYDYEFRDLTLINKFALIRTRSYVFSGGFGLRLPTGRDSSLRVYDGVNTNPNVSDSVQRPDGSFIAVPNVTAFRSRDVSVDLRTVSITPFLAATGSLGRCSFYNAFTSLEVPIGKNKVRYQETYTDVLPNDPNDPIAGFVPDGQPGSPTFSFNDNDYSVFSNPVQTAEIGDQTLLNFDLSFGRWVYQACHHRRLRRAAILGELHYTTTLDDADRASFQSYEPDSSTRTQTAELSPPGSDVLTASFATPVDEAPYQVGNLANRIDSLNMNLGLVTQWSDSWWLATGVGVPLRDASDALFDWELQVQLNFYPSGLSGLPPMF